MSYFDEAEPYEIVSHDGGPCPVCGVSGGNCKGEADSADQIRFIPKVPLDDPFATFTVPERIYEEHQEGGRTVRSLLHAKGSRIRPEEAKRLGLMP